MPLTAEILEKHRPLGACDEKALGRWWNRESIFCRIAEQHRGVLPRRAEAHAVAGREKRRTRAAGIPHFDRRTTENLPPAGAVGGINTGELAPQRHRARGHARARTLPARDIEKRVIAREVHKA